MNDKGLQKFKDQYDSLWDMLRNQSSRNHRRVMNKLRKKQAAK